MNGILAIFDNKEDLMQALHEARKQGFESLEAYAPLYDQELVEAIVPGLSPVHRLTLLGGVTGAAAGLALTIWTTAQWPILITGGKPLQSIPPFLVIVFTLTILLGSIGTFIGFLLWGILGRVRHPLPYDGRFTDGHFGLWVACPAGEAEKVTQVMKQKGAIECHVS